MTDLPAWATDYLTKHLAILTEGLRETGHLQPYQRLYWDVTPLRDPRDWCPAHGGTAAPEVCDDDSHPIPPDTRPPCTCSLHSQVGHHATGCPRYVQPITLPEVSTHRGSITYPRSST